MSVVVLDANALLMPFQFRLNLDKELRRLFGEVDVVVPGCVLGELANSRDRNSRAAIALAKKYRVVDTSLRGDDAVLEMDRQSDAAVLTNDRELIRRLKAEGIPVVRLRSGRYLVLAEHGIV